MSIAVRAEHDMLGTHDVPAGALYGVHTARALENFPYGSPVLGDVPEFCRALVMVKRAAARANLECGVLDRGRGGAIVSACDELLADPELLRANLVLPVLQGGAGTSTNMNVNEVVANRALQLLGHEPGDYEHLHPNDHVNRSQSTNDVYPTALRVALILRNRVLEEAFRDLAAALGGLAEAHPDTVKLGRTQLRDAVPMLIADEIGAWADGCRQTIVELSVTADRRLVEVHLGGTAIGTGLGAPAGYADLALRFLAEECAIALRPAARPISATTDPTALLAYSAALRSGAVRVAKLANDLRLLSSGPRTGLGELRLPPVQAGSSMMPGKVNPVIPEFVNQLCFRVHGLDLATTLALDAAQLQLSAMAPAAAASLFEAQDCLRVACEALAERCVAGIAVDEARLGAYAAAGLGELTEAASTLGYEESSRLAREAERAGLPPAVEVASDRGGDA
ncbi:MAG: aspartate ammonia-lyase [Actinobacteria bacterium]|nr:aspartate ammonia-lyase [Actinomycetota bacterium]